MCGSTFQDLIMFLLFSEETWSHDARCVCAAVLISVGCVRGPVFFALQSREVTQQCLDEEPDIINSFMVRGGSLQMFC